MDAEKHLGSLQGFLAVGLNPQCPPPLHDASQGWPNICNDQQLLPPFLPQTRLGEAKEAGAILSPWFNAKHLCGYLSAQTWSLSNPHPSQLQGFNRELTSPQPSCRRAGPYPTLDCVLSFWRVPERLFFGKGHLSSQRTSQSPDSPKCYLYLHHLLIIKVIS